MSITLQGALRTCKVDPGWANKIQSDRFENPDLMVCPVWTGRDLAGRPVCADSFYTKREGCNSALDRLYVENALRPQYMEYINLDAVGFRKDGDIYYGKNTDKSIEQCTRCSTNMGSYNTGLQTISMNQIPKITGNFGLVPSGSDVVSRCDTYPMREASIQEAEVAEKHRRGEMAQHGMQSYVRRAESGMR